MTFDVRMLLVTGNCTLLWQGVCMYVCVCALTVARQIRVVEGRRRRTEEKQEKET